MDVAITYHRDEQGADQTLEQIQQIGLQALKIQVDLADPSGPDRVFERFTSAFGRLDALINNAGRFTPSVFGQIDPQGFGQEMVVNALAPLLLTQRFARLLADGYDPDVPATSGRVVNMIDMHVLGQPLRGFATYNASKAALHEITLTCAMELAPVVTVNAIAPGVVAWADAYTPEARSQYLRRVPLARPGTVDDVATAVTYLVRDAHYATGQVIRLDGGRLLT